LIVIGAGIVIALAFLAWLRFMGSRQVVPLPIQPPDLNGAGGIDPAMETLAVGDSAATMFDKYPDIDKLAPQLEKLRPLDENVAQPTEFDKLGTDVQKIQPAEFDKLGTDVQKIRPIEPNVDNLTNPDAPPGGLGR